MTQFTDRQENEIAAWYKDNNPSDNDASLLFELTVFAAKSQKPLVRLLDIEAPVSGPDWWKASP